MINLYESFYGNSQAWWGICHFYDFPLNGHTATEEWKLKLAEHFAGWLILSHDFPWIHQHCLMFQEDCWRIYAIFRDLLTANRIPCNHNWLQRSLCYLWEKFTTGYFHSISIVPKIYNELSCPLCESRNFYAIPYKYLINTLATLIF